jgi:predicted XRE-type DNA-binding protein
MTKAEAVAMFGGLQRHLAEALGVTPSAVSQWPDGQLEQALEDRVIGAAVRLGKLPLRAPVGQSQEAAR